MPSRLRFLPALSVALAAGLVLSAGPVSAQSIEQARRERAEVQERLDAAAEQLADVEARLGTLEQETARLDEQATQLAAAADAADARVADRVREMYKRGVDTPVLHLLAGDDLVTALERAELAGHVLADDQVEIEQAAAARARAAETADRLAARRQALATAQEEQQATLAELRDDLSRARALEERLVEQKRRREAAARRRAEEAARRQAEEAAGAAAPPPTASAPAAPSSSGTACPVGRPHSFTDTWGAPRSGGRSHEGTDILADYGTPVYAIVSGVWDIYSYGSSAGNWAILHGNNGHDYWYMHLQAHVVGDGTAVSAGQQTGTVGDTGNAEGTPHVHFEYHPGGGGPVNPYPLVRDAC